LWFRYYDFFSFLALHFREIPYCFRNNNAIAAELLEKYMKRLSDSRTPDSLRHRLALGGGDDNEEDPDSPLYASPTAYGYAKIGAYNRREGGGGTTGRGGGDGGGETSPPTSLLQNQASIISNLFCL
jgi:hypothetical protein